MQFLVITKSREAVPPEMALPALQGMKKWVAELRASGKMVDAWSFAGSIAGGGILEVDDLEELDAIMTRFPFAAFSNVEVQPLTNLEASLDRAEANLAEILQAMQAAG